MLISLMNDVALRSQALNTHLVICEIVGAGMAVETMAHVGTTCVPQKLRMPKQVVCLFGT